MGGGGAGEGEVWGNVMFWGGRHDKQKKKILTAQLHKLIYTIYSKTVKK